MVSNMSKPTSWRRKVFFKLACICQSFSTQCWSKNLFQAVLIQHRIVGQKISRPESLDQETWIDVTGFLELWTDVAGFHHRYLLVGMYL